MKEYILCAAVWYPDMKLEREGIPNQNPINVDRGAVFCGHRHAHCMWTMVAVTGLKSVEPVIGEIQQGFLTNLNRFVSRQEAYKIAFSADQIIGPNKGRPENEIGLTSEDLY